MRSLSMAVFLSGMALAQPAMAGSPVGEPVDQNRIAQLVLQLGSNRFHEREAASQALEEIGAPALACLRQALSSPDVEQVRRADDLLDTIGKRVEAARLLAPQRIRLSYKNTPLPEAVADLARKSGFAITFEGGRSKLLDRRVTLETGETTFWEAFDQFCRNAGAVERSVAPVPAPNAYQATLQQRQRLILLGERGSLPRSSLENRLVLVDGQPQDLPTCYAGAVRIRALPTLTRLWGQTQAAGEALLALEVSPEPRMTWQSVVDVRVDRAVDDRDQLLMQPLEVAATGSEAQVRMVRGAEGARAEASWAMPVRLKLEQEPARLLKELRGTVTLQLQTPAEELISVDQVEKAAGRTVKSTDGGSVKILEVERESNGSLKVHIQMATTPGMAVWGALGGPVRVNRAVWVGNGTPPRSANANWTLFTDKGAILRPIRFESTITGNGNWSSQDVRLVFPPQATSAVADKLVYTGQRQVLLDVPFALKDVPLP